MYEYKQSNIKTLIKFINYLYNTLLYVYIGVVYMCMKVYPWHNIHGFSIWFLFFAFFLPSSHLYSSSCRVKLQSYIIELSKSFPIIYVCVSKFLRDFFFAVRILIFHLFFSALNRLTDICDVTFRFNFNFAIVNQLNVNFDIIETWLSCM